jgi:hypothetical protein
MMSSKYATAPTSGVFLAKSQEANIGGRPANGCEPGYGLSRDLTARIQSPGYSPWLMAALHGSEPDQPAVKRRIRKNKQYVAHGEVDTTNHRVVRTEAEREDHHKAMARAANQRARARAAATRVNPVNAFNAPISK